jgi:hypothetical protein
MSDGTSLPASQLMYGMVHKTKHLIAAYLARITYQNISRISRTSHQMHPGYTSVINNVRKVIQMKDIQSYNEMYKCKITY